MILRIIIDIAIIALSGLICIAVADHLGAPSSLWPGDVDFRAPRAVCPEPPTRPSLILPATVTMRALATNDRRLAGARCQGSMIGPTVRMLA